MAAFPAHLQTIMIPLPQAQQHDNNSCNQAAKIAYNLKQRHVNNIHWLSSLSFSKTANLWFSFRGDLPE